MGLVDGFLIFVIAIGNFDQVELAVSIALHDFFLSFDPGILVGSGGRCGQDGPVAFALGQIENGIRQSLGNLLHTGLVDVGEAARRIHGGVKRNNLDARVHRGLGFRVGGRCLALRCDVLGDRLLLVADERGEYAYCPREEQQRRIKFLKQNKNASVMLSMGWEVKDGDVPETTEPESELPVFGNLTEPALVDFLSDPAEKAAEPTEEEPASEEAASEAPEAEPQPETEPETKEVEEALMEDTPAEEPEEVPEEPAPVETPKTDSVPDITPEELRQARALLDRLLPAKETEKEDDPENGITLIRGGAPLRYTGDLSEDGKREGFGRTVNNNGITLYEGEYKNDLREGFGVHHYRSGAVSYIGDFKDDQREGFGVSFRESDHALHISHWQNGKPQGMATIFNKNGDLIYNGQIIDGQKQGAGVSVDPETHCVFVEKYENNEKAGQATLFDADGNLIYSGGWQNGKRKGHGTAFDKNGNVVYTGEWKDDRYENGILYRHVQNEDKA